NADQAAAIHCPHATPLADGSWVNQAPLSQFFYTSMYNNLAGSAYLQAESVIVMDSMSRAVWAVKWHPNAASDINTYYSEYARAAFMHAAWRVLEEGLANMTGIQAEVAQIYSATVEATRFTGLLDPQILYWQQIDFTPSSPPP
ncbi:hypothetical protein HaLaN_00136, partial [Haematococcus lacustris]